MPGITSLLDIGKKSLFANQAAIEVIGNNISNANTPGYSRQAVRLEDGLYINYSPGQLGTGVNAAEVIRYFDEFIEGQYNSKASERERWATLHESLQNVERILNEANTSGIGSALAAFWADWQTLSNRPDNPSARDALLGQASTLERAIQSTDADLRKLQDEVDSVIAAETDEINQLLGSIAELNAQINVNEVTGKNNANGLRDQRATLVRQLAEKIDINYIDNGLGNVTITTTAGHTLLNGSNTFRVAFEGPQVVADISSSFSGALRFEGGTNSEYTVRVTSAGSIGGAGAAQYQVSVDGGRTWLKDEAGNDTFTADTYANRVLLPDGSLTIYFEPGTGSNDLGVGDSFQVLTKKSLFWYETATSKENITPQILPNGQDNERRVTDGSLAGYFQFRDDSVGGYLERLNAFSESLAWEVNRIHSQGAGMSRFSNTIGTFGVTNTGAALGGPGSGLVFGDKLTQGNVMLHVFSATTGEVVRSQSLNFGGGNFDPTVHSLTDVRAAFDALEGVSASILDGKLQITADTGYDFAFGTDTCGLMAALGINTFFEGSDSRTLAVNTAIRSNIDLLNTGHVNGAGEMNEGDNTTAADIAQLQYRAVKTTTLSDGTTTQTLGSYYSTLVARVGSETQNAKFNSEYQSALAADLAARQDAVSGVNLDEEMTNLIKFQHAYTSAAKLITTAESMLQVLLGLKN